MVSAQWSKSIKRNMDVLINRIDMDFFGIPLPLEGLYLAPFKLILKTLLKRALMLPRLLASLLPLLPLLSQTLLKRLPRRGVVQPRSLIPGLLLEPPWKLFRRREVRSLKSMMQLGRQRCEGSDNTTLAADVTVSCLEHVISSSQGQEEYAKELAAMIFPLILVMPKSQSINLKVLNAAKNLQWPLYLKVTTIDSPEQKLAHKSTAALNMDNINVMAESFLANSDEYVQWFVGYVHDLDQSKTLFFLILLQSLMKPPKDFHQFFALYESCFPILIKEWEKLETTGFGASTEESNRSMLDRDCRVFLDQMYGMQVEELNAEILICIFWRLLDSFIAIAHEDVPKLRPQF